MSVKWRALAKLTAVQVLRLVEGHVPALGRHGAVGGTGVAWGGAAVSGHRHWACFHLHPQLYTTQHNSSEWDCGGIAWKSVALYLTFLNSWMYVCMCAWACMSFVYVCICVIPVLLLVCVCVKGLTWLEGVTLATPLQDTGNWETTYLFSLLTQTHTYTHAMNVLYT